MQSRSRRTTIACLGLLLLVVVQAHGQEECEGPYKGKQVPPRELAQVLEEHRKYLERSNGRMADLCGARLPQANLQGADLREADLRGAHLLGAHLREAHLLGAHLREAHLLGAHLREAHLQHANLQHANLLGAHLQQADLLGAHLQQADLQQTDLRKALLISVDLKESSLGGADVSFTVFQPNSLPNIESMILAYNLSTLRFSPDQSHALYGLREVFKKGGWHWQEREITYAIKHGTRCHKLPVFCSLPSLVEYSPLRPITMLDGAFNLLFLEWPYAYGRDAARPLLILVALIPVFMFPYRVALRARAGAGIWAVWLPDRVHKHPEEERPVRVTDAYPLPPPWPTGRWWDTVGRAVRAALIALYFSMLSAFHIGWRDLNVGNWITRIQPREYTLRATGWVRTISGIQSLISVYLLALWAFTYIAQQFE